MSNKLPNNMFISRSKKAKQFKQAEPLHILNVYDYYRL